MVTAICPAVDQSLYSLFDKRPLPATFFRSFSSQSNLVYTYRYSFCAEEKIVGTHSLAFFWSGFSKYPWTKILVVLPG